MAKKTAVLAVRIISDGKPAAKGFQQASTAAETFEKGLAKADRAAKIVAGGLIGIGAAAAHQASELEQSAGAVDSVFKKQADAVHELARSAARDMGLSRAEYSQTSAVFGSQLKNMGVAAQELIPTTDRLIGLGADLSATYGGTAADAVAAIGSLMRGERDPIEKFGVSIKQADINARMAADGTSKLEGEARKQAETQATLSLLFEQTADAQGQFAREADTAAGATQIAKAEFADAGAELGDVLLPAVADVTGGLADMASKAAENKEAVYTLAGIVGGLAGVVIITNAALKTYAAFQAIVTGIQILWNAQLLTTRLGLMAIAIQQGVMTVATKAWAAAQWVLNAAMSANPIGLIIIAVVALIAGMVLLYKRSETFRNIVNAVGRAGKAAFGWIVDKVKSAWNWVKKLWDKVKQIKWPKAPKWMETVGQWGSYLFGSASYAAAGAGSSYGMARSVSAPAGQLMGASGSMVSRRAGGSGYGFGVQIIVNGATDPVATGREVEKALRRSKMAGGGSSV